MAMQNKEDANEFVESVKKIHFLVLILTSLAVLAGLAALENEGLPDKITSYDYIYTIEKALNSNQEHIPINTENLPFFLGGWRQAAIAAGWDLEDIESQEIVTEHPEDAAVVRNILEQKRTLPNAFIIQGVQFVSNPGVECSLLGVGGIGDEPIEIFSSHSQDQLREVKVKDVYILFIPRKCMHGQTENVTAIAIRSKACDEGTKNRNCHTDWLIGLRDKYFQHIAPLKWGDMDPLYKLNVKEKGILNHLLPAEKELLKEEDSYNYQGIEFYNSRLFQLATEIKKKFYRPEQTKQALDDIMQYAESDVDFLGLKLKDNLFIKVSPVLILILMYKMYRYLLIVKERSQHITKPWIIKSVRSEGDFLITLLIALTPIISVIIVGGIYARAENTGLVFLGHEISLKGIIAGEIPDYPKYVYNDKWAQLISFIFLISLYYAYLCEKLLYDLTINLNKKYAIRIRTKILNIFRG